MAHVFLRRGSEESARKKGEVQGGSDLKLCSSIQVFSLVMVVVVYKNEQVIFAASGLLPAGTAILRPADANGVGLEIRYLVRL